jgi:hypothetical protein
MHDRGHRVVSFAEQPLYYRPARWDENYVMEHFQRHAEGCRYCCDPRRTVRKGGMLCDKGHLLAQDVARYLCLSKKRTKGEVYEEEKPYSTFDRNMLGQRVHVTIPPQCKTVRDLLVAIRRGILQPVDNGLEEKKPRPVSSYDRYYHVPRRPERQSHHAAAYGFPAQDPGRYPEDHRYYDKDGRYRARDDRYDYTDKYHHSEKRQSIPSSYVPHGSLGLQDTIDRAGRQVLYDGNYFYYYKPSKHEPERRIPRSESPTREALRRMRAEDRRSSRYGFPASHRSSRYGQPEDRYSPKYGSPDSNYSPKYGSPDSKYSPKFGSPDSRRSSRYGFPEEFYPSRRYSPDSYSDRRTSWSPERLYRSLFR